MPFGWSLMKSVFRKMATICRNRTPIEEEVETPVPTPEPEGKSMDALTYMREHIKRHMQGNDDPQEYELDSLVTDNERQAMHETPFGRINDMIGAMTGTQIAGDVEMFTPPVFRFTQRQISLIETVHNKFLRSLFENNPYDLATVYEDACTEDEYEQFMDDFPAA